MVWIIIGGIILVPILFGIYEGTKEGIEEIKTKKKKLSRLQEVREKVIELLNLRTQLQLPAIQITASKKISSDLFESRIGGKPVWPQGKEKPKQFSDFPLVFLAQINFSKMPKLEGFPSKGLLQFFITADDLYGMRFPDDQSDGKTLNSDIHVIYHESLAGMEEWDMFPVVDDIPYDTPFDYDHWWDTSYKMEFSSPLKMFPTFDDYRINDKYWDIEKYFTNSDTFYEYSDKWDEGQPKSSVVGGHPHFTQADPRSYSDELKEYSMCLISFTSSDILLWGDCGTGSFLIRPEDLSKKNFNNILYNYDCL